MSLAAELARMTAYYQLRAIATQMGADPDTVDPRTLTLAIAHPQPPAADNPTTAASPPAVASAAAGFSSWSFG